MNIKIKVLLIGSIIILVIVAVMLINIKTNDINSNSFDLQKEVYEYAEKNYAKEPKKKAAFLQSATALNAIVHSLYDRDKLDEMEERAASCDVYVFNKRTDEDIHKIIKPLVINTAEKVRVYIKWNKSFSGTMLGDRNYSIDEACDE